MIDAYPVFMWRQQRHLWVARPLPLRCAAKLLLSHFQIADYSRGVVRFEIIRLRGGRQQRR